MYIIGKRMLFFLSLGHDESSKFEFICAPFWLQNIVENSFLFLACAIWTDYEFNFKTYYNPIPKL